MITIKHRYARVVILQLDLRTLINADLRGVNLRCADLRGVNLRCANLCDADLRGADLRYANLCDANLRCADLRYANLCDANLCGANLRCADLESANQYNIFSLTQFDFSISCNGHQLHIGCEKVEITDNLYQKLLSLGEKHRFTEERKIRFISIIMAMLMPLGK